MPNKQSIKKKALMHRKKKQKKKKKSENGCLLLFICTAVRNVSPTQIKIIKFKLNCQISDLSKDLKIQSNRCQLLQLYCRILQSDQEVCMEYIAVSVSVSVFICFLSTQDQLWATESEYPSSAECLTCFEPAAFQYQRKVLTH